MTGQTTARGAGGNLRYTTITSDVAGFEGQIVICFEEGMTWYEYYNSKYVINVDGGLRLTNSMTLAGVKFGSGPGNFFYIYRSGSGGHEGINNVISEDEAYYLGDY